MNQHLAPEPLHPPDSPEGGASAARHSLLAQAEACHAAGDVPGTLAAARALWHNPPAGLDEATRCRAGWLLASGLHRSSAYAEQLALVDRLMPGLRRQGGPAFNDYLRWVVLAGCELARFDLALPLAYEAVALADAQGDPRVRAMATNAFAVCFERMGDPWQSERLMGEALALAREAASPPELFTTLNNLCAVLIGAHYLLRGVGAGAGAQPPEALAPLQRALPLAREAFGLLSAMPLPLVRVIGHGNLGEVLLHLGEVDEARQLLDAARSLAEQHALAPLVQRVRCSQAELALREDRPADARELLAPVLAHEVAVQQTALRAHHAAYLAAQRLGDVAAALHHLEQHAYIVRQRMVLQLQAQSALFVTRVESERLRERARLLEAVTRSDPLTSLGNRRELDERLPVLLQATQAAGQPLSLAMVDIDTYKAINDRHGHPVGDQVLVNVARVLREHVRATDLVARLGGDEFVLVLPDTSGARALELCERIRSQVAGHDWQALAPGLVVSVSIGVAATPPHDMAPLIARADAALYRAKRGGRNRSEAG